MLIQQKSLCQSPHIVLAAAAALGLFGAKYPLQTIPALICFCWFFRTKWTLGFVVLFFLLGQLNFQIPGEVSRVTIERIDREVKFGSSLYMYRGSAGGVPVTWISKNLYEGSELEVKGQIKESPWGYKLELSKASAMTPVAIVTGGLPLWRLRVREWALQTLKKRYSSRVSESAAAFFLGKRPSKQVRLLFRKAGLSHLLCLSGFHFGALAWILGLLWPAHWLPRRRSLFMIGLLSLYALIVGDAPSVGRAYFASLLYFAAPLFGQRSNAVVSLSLMALFELTTRPWVLFSAGFQLSYGVTAALLLFGPIMSELFNLTANLDKLSLLDLHVYTVNKLLSRGCALHAAVSVAALPLSLIHFGSYPCIALFTNLIYPSLLAIAFAALPITSAPLECALTSLELLPRYLCIAIDGPLPAWLGGAALVLALRTGLGAGLSSGPGMGLDAALTPKALPDRITDYSGGRSSVG